jgi:transcriptional regulator with GAF, ATPase, and Fis domain
MDKDRLQRRQLAVLSRVRQTLDGLYQSQRIDGDHYDLRPALEKVLELAAHELQFDRDKRAERALVVLHAGDGELEVSAGWSAGDAEAGLSQTVIHRVLDEGRAIIVADARADERFRSAESLHEATTLSIVAAPIRIDGAAVGAVYLDTSRLADAFTGDDAAFLTRFAEVVAPHLKSGLIHRKHLSEISRLKAEISAVSGFDNLIGDSPAMRRVLDLMRRVAPDPDVKVLIRGESGTGKELVARALHAAGPRRERAFVAVNCAALPRDLLESELFGHERGAFTGAVARRIGRFEEAHRGTLFLDEIGEMDPALQAKLLRVLQDGTFQRLGGTGVISSDVRVIAATHRNLESLVAGGAFREDLYHRLNVVTIDVPPLRDRKEDILLLAAHLLARYNKRRGRSLLGVDAEAEAALLGYAWPGNVRELENVVERAAILCDGPYILLENLPAAIRERKPAGGDSTRDATSRNMTLEELNRLYARAVVERCRTKGEACQVLGITDKTLNRLLGGGD